MTGGASADPGLTDRPGGDPEEGGDPVEAYAVALPAGRPVADGGLGGKGRALARLIESGFPVPATGVVTIAAYRRVARAPAITELIERIAGERRVPEAEVDQIFASVAIDPDVEAALLDLVATVGDGQPVAVRSSATVEDLHGSSFAGQYRSVLNVDASNTDDVLRAIRSVWASLWHPAPAAYRRAFGVSEHDAAMAVVVMRMIPADSAGVVFTADPGGGPGARIEAVEGLGESLVSGQRTPQAWVVANGDGTAVPANPPTESPSVPPTAQPTVPAEALPTVPAEALRQALAVEHEFGVPQDVEWAAAGDEVFVLQARPITVLEDHDGFDTAVDEHELTTAGIVEMVPGVLPPLRWEINRFLLEEAFRSVLDSLGIIRGTAAEDRPFVRRVRGRTAIDFDQLREAAAGIPGAVAELETQYFGQPDTARSPGGTAGDGPRSFGARLVRQVQDLGRDLRTLQTRRKVIEQAEVLILATAALADRRPLLADTSDHELLAYVRRLIDLAARGLAAELGVAAAGAASYRRLELQLGKHLGETAGRRWTQRVTAQAGVVLHGHPSASAAVFGGPTWSELGTRPPNDPATSTPPSTPDTSSTDDVREELRRTLRALPGWTRTRLLTGGVIDVRMRLIDVLVTDVVEQLRRRERAKAAFLGLGGEVRRVHHEIGRRLVERSLLDERDWVELLTGAELVATLTAGERVPTDLLGRRRNWLSRYEVEGSLPQRFRGRPQRHSPVPLPEGDVLHGWAAGPGRRRGTARVITAPTESLNRGEVLVAEATDASWSPLFIRAGAVVVERGGPLSHAAILARELGLPAVLNVAGATRLLDGEVVSVDGDQGVVVIEHDSLPDDAGTGENPGPGGEQA